MQKFPKKFRSYLRFRNFFIILFIAFLLYCYINSAISEKTSEKETEIILITSISASLSFLVLGNIFSLIQTYLFIEKSGYKLNEDTIYCEYGAFIIRKTTLEYNKINSVLKKQTFIQKIFGVAYLDVNSGSTNTALTGEIKICHTNDGIDILKEKIEAYKNNNFEEEEHKIEEKNDDEIYKMNYSSKLLYAVSKILSIGIIILFAVVALLSIYFLIFNDLVEFNDPEGPSSIYEILFLMGITFIGFAFVLSISFIVSLSLRLYDYKIYKNNESVEIHKGLFVRNVTKFDISKIRAIRYDQNLFQRIFKLATIYIDVVGYVDLDNNNVSSGMLVPCASLDKVLDIIKLIDDKYVFDDEIKYSPKKYFPFISLKLIGICFYLLPLSIILLIFDEINPVLTILIYLIITLVSVIGLCYLSYRAQSIKVSKLGVCVSVGCLNKKTYVILKKNIVSIEKDNIESRIKNGILNYTIHFYSNAFSNTIKAINIDDSVEEELYSLIEY